MLLKRGPLGGTEIDIMRAILSFGLILIAGSCPTESGPSAASNPIRSKGPTSGNVGTLISPSRPYRYPILDLTPPRTKIEDALRHPEVLPVATKRVPPVYPAAAVRARVSGIVIVRVLIERDGRVSGARVLKPLPFGLTEASIAAVRGWQFRPAYTKGKPVRALYDVAVLCRPPAPKPPS